MLEKQTYVLRQEYSFMDSLDSVKEDIVNAGQKIKGGLERILGRKKNECHVIDQEDMPINLEKVRIPEYSVEGDKLTLVDYVKKIPKVLKNGFFTIANGNAAVAIYQGAMMGYYHTYDKNFLGITGLIGALPNFLEAGKQGEENTRVNDVFYYGAVGGLVIGGISKIIAAEKDGSLNENMFFWPAVADLGLAGYHLFNRIQIVKRIKNKSGSD